MRNDLVGLLDKADLAVTSCRGVIEDVLLTPLIEAVDAVRTRISYPDDILVVALAGGTGSGKSSLLNAIAGEELVEVGGIRPTTSHPAAAVPAIAAGSLDGYLDLLGVDERYVYDQAGLCLIDLPDMDSVETEHRHRVDVLLPRVDVVVWVTDPEKYRDHRLHRDYLQPMAAYSDQFVFVMNQIDRLTPAQAGEVSHDLAMALEADGLGPVEVFPIAAFPPSGPPIGIDLLLASLEVKHRDQDGLYGKLLADLAGTTKVLESAVGPVTGFDSRAQDAVEIAAESVSAGDSPRAINELTAFLDAIGAEAGAVSRVKLEKLAAEVADHVGRIEEELARRKPLEREGWFRRRRRQEATSDLDLASSLLGEAIIRPARAIIARRALAIASISELAVAVEGHRRRQ